MSGETIAWGPWEVRRSTGRAHKTHWTVGRSAPGFHFELMLNDRGSLKKFRSSATAQAACDKANGRPKIPSRSQDTWP